MTDWLIPAYLATNRCLFGDCRDSMRSLIAQCVKVQMCVTSPPYWGLRDYGHAGQLGLEETPEQYVTNMVEVFRLVRELLADDGTLWLNLGDSYAGYWGQKYAHKPFGKDRTPDSSIPPHKKSPDFKTFCVKNKDLIGIPWRVAFALQADGWYLRQDIIWHKPNPMPESVRDRCTKSHEYIFLLSKSPRYYFNNEAIKEPVKLDSYARYERGRSDNHKWADGGPGNQTIAKSMEHMRKGCPNSSGNVAGKANKRSVWTISTKPYKGAHFATFPPDLVEPCILAGSRPGDIVLDPFFGSGTTGQVAQQLGRQWIGCEINEEYEILQTRRLLR